MFYKLVNLARSQCFIINSRVEKYHNIAKPNRTESLFTAIFASISIRSNSVSDQGTKRSFLNVERASIDKLSEGI